MTLQLEQSKLERKLEKMMGQLLRRLALNEEANGVPAVSALREVERHASELIARSIEIDLNTPAFQTERITYLGRAAAILVRQAEKVSSQFPGTDPERLLDRVTCAASRKLSDSWDLSSCSLPSLSPVVGR